MSSSTQAYKLIYFVPPSNLSETKSAIFAAGAGFYPPYSEVCFITHGKGQFKPGSEANPHIGEPGKLEEVEEVKVEIMCKGEEVVRKAVEGLKRTHPYEVPVYEVYKIEEF